MGLKESHLIVFSKKDVPKVLDIFNKSVDEEGYIIDKETGLRVVSNEGEELLAEDLGNILKGSEVFIKADPASFSKFLAEREEEL